MGIRKYPLPPFMPAGRIIQDHKWKDSGEWKDDYPLYFDGTGPSPP